MLLSIIIPIFNCERFIGRCIESIDRIAIDDYEVIIVDDGSTDNSNSICKKICHSKNNYTLIQQLNSGTSVARNRGVDVAKGDYIWFVDADDTINPEIPILLRSWFAEGVDLICFNYKKVWDNREEFIHDYSDTRFESGLDYLALRKRSYLWNKIYRREAIGKHRFVEGIKNLEDMFFNLETVIDMRNIVSTNIIGYNYHQDNETGTSRNKSLKNLVKLSRDSIKVHGLILHKLYSQENDKKRKHFLMECLNLGIAGHLFSIFQFYNPKFLIKVIQIYENWGVYPVGNTGNKKANRFLFIANRKTLFVSLYKIAYTTTRLRKCFCT